ncbi:Caspase domain [Rhizoctonia solani]|uniref:Caspase domain n=1 Tax=Rhizoctonia solani TaxID=456999 RepID=A0A8H7I9H9_9AGAM|nr:Caspase domain [Rhizoctonia solani]
MSLASIQKLIDPSGKNGRLLKSLPDLLALSAKPPLHALVIGINKYKENVHLVGAVPDALAFKSYLTDDLRVPEEQITLLVDEQATRANIIEALQNIGRPDNGISRDDPIVIYYAGHGGQVDPPPDKTANTLPVQCIIPQDTSKESDAVPIPDFTIGALVHCIAQEKGNNITVIFDCCHSTVGSRNIPENVRFVDKADLPKLPSSLDEDIIQATSSDFQDVLNLPSPEILFGDQDSHVTLAACGYGEAAFEDTVEKRGYFSSALLKLLRSVQIDSLSYRRCIQRLPQLLTRQPQNPVCEGKHADRMFFNARVQGPSACYIPIKPDADGLYLQAGLVHGITPGATYDIHASDVPDPSDPPLATLEVHSVEPFVSHLKGTDVPNLPTVCYGRQADYGPSRTLDIHITQEFADEAVPSDVWARLFRGSLHELVVRPVEPELASVIVSVNSKKETTFTLKNPVLVEHRIETLPSPDYPTIPPEAERVIPVLTSLSQWDWHLRHTPDVRPFHKMIDIEFYQLQMTGEYTDEGNPVLVPEGNNLNADGVADIIANLENYYGFKVVNRSRENLYVSMVDFSGQWEHPVADTPNPTIPANASLTIGYGSGEQMPLMFALNDDQDIDVNFFKFFVSKMKELFEKDALWDALTISVVQRAHPKEEDPVRIPSPDSTTTEPPAEPEPTTEPTTEPTPAPAPDPDPAAGPGTGIPFTGRSEEPLQVQARSAAVANGAWFRTPGLTKELIASIRHDAAHVLQAANSCGGHRNRAYYEISVIGNDDLPKLLSDETEMIYRSHSAPSDSEYKWENGVAFDESHELWSKLEPGTVSK